MWICYKIFWIYSCERAKEESVAFRFLLGGSLGSEMDIEKIADFTNYIMKNIEIGGYLYE